MKGVSRSYAVRGFGIIAIFVDIQFKALKDTHNFDVIFNVVSREEDMLKIECSHRVVKE